MPTGNFGFFPHIRSAEHGDRYGPTVYPSVRHVMI